MMKKKCVRNLQLKNEHTSQWPTLYMYKSFYYWKLFYLNIISIKKYRLADYIDPKINELSDAQIVWQKSHEFFIVPFHLRFRSDESISFHVFFISSRSRYQDSVQWNNGGRLRKNGFDTHSLTFPIRNWETLYLGRDVPPFQVIHGGRSVDSESWEYGIRFIGIFSRGDFFPEELLGIFCWCFWIRRNISLFWIRVNVMN